MRPLAEAAGGLPLRADLVAQQKRLHELEERVRKMRQAQWHSNEPAEQETDGWLLSYLDLLTLLLVMVVALLALYEPPSAEPQPVATTPGTAAAPTWLHDWQLPAMPPVLVSSTADLPMLPWESRAESTWQGLTSYELPAAVVIPDFTAREDIPASDAPLTLELPYTPVPALTALAPPRPVIPRVGPPHFDDEFSMPAATHAPLLPWSPRAPVALGAVPYSLADGPSSLTRATPSQDAGPPALPPNLDLSLLGDGIDVIVQERSVSFRISNEILFALGQVDLTPRGVEVLERVTAVLRDNDYPIAVEGHTDPIPIQNERFPSNWELSTFRATSVLRHLEAAGITADRLRAVGYADTRPIAENNTADGRALNRRVELILEMPAGNGENGR